MKKNYLFVFGMLISASNFAQVAEEANAVELYANVKEVTYLKAVENGGLTPGKAWEGTRILRLQDGSCVQIFHSKLKLVKIGDLQRPEFTEAKTKVSCPKDVNVD